MKAKVLKAKRVREMGEAWWEYSRVFTGTYTECTAYVMSRRDSEKLTVEIGE